MVKPRVRKKQIYKRIFIDMEDAKWFEDYYPGSSYSWLFSMLLKSFRSLHIVSPKDISINAALDVKRQAEAETEEVEGEDGNY